MKKSLKLLLILLTVCVIGSMAFYFFYPVFALKGKFLGNCTLTKTDNSDFIVYQFASSNFFLKRILAQDFVTTYHARSLNVGETFDCTLGVNVFCSSCNQLQVTDIKIQEIPLNRREHRLPDDPA